MRKHFTPALVISLVAIVLSSTGLAEAARHTVEHTLGKIDGHPVSAKPHAGGILLLGKNKKFPASVIPTVPDTYRLEGKTASELEPTCPANTADLGTWCLEKHLDPVPKEDAGKNSYFWASQKCAQQGGFLPLASELLGAVKDVELAGGPATPGQREMSSTVITTQAGSDAAGSEGVSEKATGNKNTGEPQPIPLPAVPEPETAQYVTVFSNSGHGGLAGGEPIKDAQNFRCAYIKTTGSTTSNEAGSSEE